MNATPDPDDDNGPPFESPVEPRFLLWLKTNPAQHELWADLVAEAAKGEAGELPPELRAQVNQLADTGPDEACINLIGEKFAAAEHIVRHPDGRVLSDDQMARLNALMDEIIDLLLEIQEPNRTQFLKEVIPMRDWLRNCRPPA